MAAASSRLFCSINLKSFSLSGPNAAPNRLNSFLQSRVQNSRFGLVFKNILLQFLQCRRGMSAGGWAFFWAALRARCASGVSGTPKRYRLAACGSNASGVRVANWS